jgi:hypothetical protein
VTLVSLAVGTALDMAVGPYQGKETGELALFRQLHHNLAEGDVLLGDRCFGSYLEIAAVQQRGADVVLRLHQCRRVDFHTGRRLGKGDHVVTWSKPTRPAWLDQASYAALPDTLPVREVRVRVTQKGFRTQTLIVVTTLRDAREVTAAELGQLYRARWQAELDLRSLKEALHMDVLRCQTPQLVEKELWAHLLVYNLIRTVMAQAAQAHDVLPTELSFTGALQTLKAFAPHLLQARGAKVQALCRELLQAVASHRVGDRPDRYEPRALKRRPKPHRLLNEPRAKARRRLAKESSG